VEKDKENCGDVPDVEVMRHDVTGTQFDFGNHFNQILKVQNIFAWLFNIKVSCYYIFVAFVVKSIIINHIK